MRQLLRVAPNATTPHHTMGSILLQQGRLAEALEHFRRVVELLPDSASAYNNLAVALNASGQPREASESCRKALQIDPDYLEAHTNLATALANQMQRAVNIFLGSVLATIGLTIPSVLILNHLLDRPIILGVEHADLALLILTLAVSIITFTSGRTNMLQGVVHLVLFAAYVLLIFQA